MLINFRLANSIKEIESQILEQNEKLDRIQRMLEQLGMRQRTQREQNYNTNMMKNFVDTIIVIVVVFFVQYIMKIWARNNIDIVKETW